MKRGIRYTSLTHGRETLNFDHATCNLKELISWEPSISVNNSWIQVKDCHKTSTTWPHFEPDFHNIKEVKLWNLMIPQKSLRKDPILPCVWWRSSATEDFPMHYTIITIARIIQLPRGKITKLLKGKTWSFRNCTYSTVLLAKLQTVLVYSWSKNSVFCMWLRCVRENYFIVNKLRGQIKGSCKGRCTTVELFRFQRNKVNNCTGICSVLGILPYRKGCVITEANIST